MTREQVRKLLGGYAAGTLTEAEETALFEAALEDQELFNELGREQALRDLLSDPAARAHLLAALDEPRPAWGQRAARWILGNAVGLAAVACFVTVGGYVAWLARDMQKPRIIAEVTEPVRIEVTDSAPSESSGQAVRKFDSESLKRKIPRPAQAPAPPSIAPRRAAAPLPSLLASAMPSAPPPQPAPAAPEGRREVEVVAQSMQFQGDLQTLAAMPRPGAAGGALSFRASAAAEERPEAAAKNEARQADASLEASQKAAGSGGGVGSGRGGGVGSGKGSGPRAGVAGSAAMPSAVIRTRTSFGPPVRYRILRKRPNGAFEPTLSASLSVGDVVKLSIEPNDSGFLTVIEVGSDQPLFSGTTERTGVVTTPEIQLSGSGPKQFRVVFTRDRSSAGYAGSSAAPAELGAGRVSADIGGQGVVYSVNSNGSPSGVTFTVTLTWK
jgi:hypothetical protein